MYGATSQPLGKTTSGCAKGWRGQGVARKVRPQTRLDENLLGHDIGFARGSTQATYGQLAQAFCNLHLVLVRDCANVDHVRDPPRDTRDADTLDERQPDTPPAVGLPYGSIPRRPPARRQAYGTAPSCIGRMPESRLSDATAVVVDVETTGTDPDRDAVVEVACSVIRGGREVRSFT
jgi:Exonuclease